MQVTQVSDHVSHAVIGANKARDFGISQSAEFFNILSNTLYSDKILAVVREVLCNAWDIHIQTGRTDTPVQVSLFDGKLTIRDFGTGISDDDIHPIYAVYGNSTKKLDGQQTGGFGLGSKSPFAYVDHFEVTSYHAGTKTIYAVSKSSAEVAGKPSIMPLVSVPLVPEADGSVSTGLAVSFSVKREDFARFRDVIRMIAQLGEMNVTYDDGFGAKPLPTIPFSQAKHGFLMLKDLQGIPGGDTSRIFVRYGNVVYPVSDHETYKDSYSNVLQLLKKISPYSRYNYDHTQWKIVFQARPDTISVTPSRESLSMTDHTANSVSELLKKFIDLSETGLEEACIQAERDAIAMQWQAGRPADLLTSYNQIPTLFDRTSTSSYNNTRKSITEPSMISDIRDMSRAYMSHAYPDFKDFHRRDTTMRLEALEKAGFGGPKNRGKLQSFRRELDTGKTGKMDGAGWFQRVIVQPLVRKIDEVPEMNGSKLLVYGEHNDTTGDKNGRRRYGYGPSTRFVEASKLSRRPLPDYMPFLRNIIVLSFNRIDVEERLPSFPIMKNELGNTKEFFVYVVSRTDKKIDIVRKFFQDLGMVVVDLTKPGAHETPAVIVPVAKPVVSKPRKKGLPQLSAILKTRIDHRGRKVTEIKHELVRTEENIARIEQPQFIVKINPRAQTPTIIQGLDNNTVVQIIRLYGDVGGIVVNDNQFTRFAHEFKIPALETWLLKKLLTEAQTNPRIQGVFAHEPATILAKSGIAFTGNQGKIFQMILKNPELAIEFGVLNETTREDRQMLSLIKSFVDPHGWHWHGNKHVMEIQAHINTIAPEPEVIDLANRIKSSKLVGLLDENLFSEVFGENPTEFQKKQKSGALDLLQYVLA